MGTHVSLQASAAARRVAPAALLLLAACGSEAPPPAGQARIIEFTATPAEVDPGQTVTLAWQTTGTTGVNVEPGVGLLPASGTVEITPFVTTTYTLSIPGGPLDLVATVDVTVRGGAPRITAFTATPRTVTAGEQVTLDWATAEADGVILEPEVGRLDSPAGMFIVQPETTTTYRLTAVRGTLKSPPSEVTVVVAGGNQPFIETFTATPQAVGAGEPVTLAWTTRNADTVALDNGLGVQGPMGTVEVRPTQTTTYNLTASGPGGQASASVTVQVATGNDPTIASFTATPQTVNVGDSVLLAWDTDDADGVDIDNGIGAQPAKGMVTINPTATTQYTLTAFGNGAQVTAQVTVMVAASGTPVVTAFEAQPAAILNGGSTTLTWATSGAATVDISDVGGGLMPTGSVTVSPTQTTTYTLTARGASGDAATAQVTVEVGTPAPTVDAFNAQPASVTAGAATTLAWQTQNTVEVNIDNGIGLQPAMGSVTVNPNQTTTYTLTAVGPGGQATAQATVTVTQAGAPSIDSFLAAPQQIAPGAQANLTWSVSNATAVSLDNGHGPQQINGALMVSPSQTTTYTLTASNQAGTTTAQTTVNVVAVSGDTCADAFTISASGTFSGNTNLASNDYSQTTACTGYTSTGPDTVYRVALQAGDRVQATLQPTGGWDASLYLVTSCQNVGTSCVAGQDNGNPEVVDYTAASAGDYFLVVDGYGSAAGAYDLDVVLNPAPLANDTCTGAIDVTAGGTFSGDTTSASGDYSPLATGTAGGCTGYPAASSDVVYRVVLNPGERLQASLSASWDASLYMITDCGDPAGSCAAGADSGNPETIDYTATQVSGFFLVVDGYGSARGPFDLTVSVSPPVVGGDTCQNPVAVTAPGGAFSANTSGLANDYDPGAACTGQPTAGPDLVYGLTLSAGDVVEAVASFASGVDGSLYAVSDCSNLTCLAGDDTGGAGGTEALRFVAEAAGPHYVVTDGRAASDAGPHDVAIDVYTGETCTQAVPLDLSGAPEAAITAGKADDYSPTSLSCTRSSSGPDRAYSVRVRPGDQLDVQLTPDANWDPTMYLVSLCSDVTGSCVVGTDRGARGVAERLAPVFDASGTYFLIVDGWAGTNGAGQISARIRRGDTCDDAYVVPPEGGQFTGTTSGYGADYGATQNAGSCTNYSQLGNDAVYAVTLDPGQTLDASLTSTWDGALYLISDCAQSATTCVAGQDNGAPETISYTHQGAAAQTYYLVVDSWRTSMGSSTREGRYTLDVGFN